jgi:Tfp pilus assembly protein PilO
VQPQRKKAASLNEQIANAQAELAGLQSGGTKRPTIRAAELFQLARAMPDTPDVAGMLLDLSRLADQSRVELVSVQPSTPAALADGSTAVPLRVTVDGSWTTITDFLGAMRRQVQVHGGKLSVGGRLFDVDSVQVAQSQDKKRAIEAQLTVNAFVYGASGVPGAATPTSTTTTTTTTSSSESQQAAGATPTGGSS